MYYKDVLEHFLNLGTQSSVHENIMQEFHTLNNSSISVLSDDNEGFVYIPGKRNDRVLLVSSLEFELNQTKQEELIFENGNYKTSKQKSYLDIATASSAILYLLKDSGHSLLIMNNDLYFPHFSVVNVINYQHKDFFEEFNAHQYILEFSYEYPKSIGFTPSTTQNFKNFIEDNTRFFEEKRLFHSSINELCERICGANVSAGYHKNKRKGLFLNLAEWEHTLNVFRNFLKEPQPQFPLFDYVGHSNDFGTLNFRDQQSFRPSGVKIS